MKEIFISHRSSDKVFADILEAFLTTCGIPSDIIFCSSLPGNDIQCEISKEIKESLNTSKLNVVILSEYYYQSPYCQNESGIIWFNDTKKIVIALPEINENLMEGFLNKENKLRRMDKKNDILAVSDMLSEIFGSFIKSSAKLNANIDRFITQYNNALQTRTFTPTLKNTSQTNELESKILSGELSDDEQVVLKYFYDTQNLLVNSDCLDIQNWLNSNQISNIRVDNGLQLLLEDQLIESVLDSLGTPAEFKLLISTYRDLRKISEKANNKLAECFDKHKTTVAQKSKNEIDNLIFKGLTAEEILLIKYIKDIERVSLFCGWQIDKETDMIRNWEEVNCLDNILSSKYTDALNKFQIRKYIEPSALTSYGNPKEYKIKDSFLNAISDLNSASQEKIEKLMQDIKYEKIPDDDLPF